MRSLAYLVELFPDLDLIRMDAARFAAGTLNMHEEALALVDGGIRRNPAESGYYLLKAELIAHSGKSTEFTIEPGREILGLIKTVLRFQNIGPVDCTRIACLCISLSQENAEIGELASILLEMYARAPGLPGDALSWALAEGLGGRARRLFLYAIEQPGSDLELELMTATLLVNLGDREALGHILTGIRKREKRDRRSVHVTVLEGYLEFLEHRPKEALAYFLKALDSNPASIEALKGLVLVYQEADIFLEKECVIDRFERAVRSSRDPAERAYLGEILRRLEESSGGNE